MVAEVLDKKTVITVLDLYRAGASIFLHIVNCYDKTICGLVDSLE